MKPQTATQPGGACASSFPPYVRTDSELDELAKFEADLSFVVFAMRHLALAAHRRDQFSLAVQMLRAGMHTLERTTETTATAFVPSDPEAEEFSFPLLPPGERRPETKVGPRPKNAHS